jgi:epsin
MLIWCLFVFFSVKKFVSFKYVEPNGKDVGLNVRKKAENVLAIVDDREKLQQVRAKAAATRDK